MKICGIIAEYNPLHNGHIYHIREAKRLTSSDFIIAIMSGNFVQRGEPAMLDKYERTKAALENGIDMVIELPTYYATASAEYFAFGAIRILENCGIVDTLCFGSESVDLTTLHQLSDYLSEEPPQYKAILKDYLLQGLSFPSAREATLRELSLIPENIMFNKPNTILGLSYLNALKKLSSSIAPYAIQRIVADYHDIDITGSIASATAIRQKIKIHEPLTSLANTVPKCTYDSLVRQSITGEGPFFLDSFSQIFHYKMLTTSDKELSTIVGINEGLEKRISTASEQHFLISEIVKDVKTKRYTFTAIQRAILHILLSLEKKSFQAFTQSTFLPYIRVLGFKKSSDIIFSHLKKHATAPIITNLKHAHNQLSPLALSMLKKEMEADEIYWLSRRSKTTKAYAEFTKQLIIVP